MKHLIIKSKTNKTCTTPLLIYATLVLSCIGYLLIQKKASAKSIKIINEDTNITSEINVHSNTGSNKGKVINEGNTEANIKIKQSINGNEKEPIVISETAQGNSIEVKVTTEAKNDGIESSTTIIKKYENKQEKEMLENFTQKSSSTEKAEKKGKMETETSFASKVKASILNLANLWRKIQKYVSGISA